jgi:tRNA-dihydrouridine synthase B
MSSGDFIKRLREEKLILPPLAGYTDYPFRRILSEFDAPFLCTEMVSSEAVVRHSPRTLKMLEKPKGGHLHGAQLFGDDPDSMASAASMLEEMGFYYVDINMGCSVKPVISNGAGVSLMGDMDKASEIASSVVESVSVPVSCKIRLGESLREINVVDFSRMLEAAGVSAITVHGRSGEKKFGEPVNYEAIRDVVESVGVPVVGNGGVFNGADALNMIELTGVDAVMPGRGLIGNPWIIPEIKAALNGEQFHEPSLVERKEVCSRHLGYLVDFMGETDGVVTMRRVLHRYFSGCVHAVDLRKRMDGLSKVDDMLSILDDLEMDGDKVVFRK